MIRYHLEALASPRLNSLVIGFPFCPLKSFDDRLGGKGAGGAGITGRTPRKSGDGGNEFFREISENLYSEDFFQEFRGGV